MLNRPIKLAVVIAVVLPAIALTGSAGSAGSGPVFTVMNTSETLPDGVYFRNSPNWNDTSRTFGLGVFMNEQVQLECYATGQAIGQYNDALWYYVLDVSRPVNDGAPNQGMLNAHYINDGQKANVVDAGVPACVNNMPLAPPAPVPPPGPAPAPTATSKAPPVPAPTTPKSTDPNTIPIQPPSSDQCQIPLDKEPVGVFIANKGNVAAALYGHYLTGRGEQVNLDWSFLSDSNYFVTKARAMKVGSEISLRDSVNTQKLYALGTFQVVRTSEHCYYIWDTYDFRWSRDMSKILETVATLPAWAQQLVGAREFEIRSAGRL